MGGRHNEKSEHVSLLLRDFQAVLLIYRYDKCLNRLGEFVKKYRQYIIESNPHDFYSFRGLKNQMRIRIACGLDSRSRAEFWKNDRAAVRAVRTIQ